MATQPVQDRGRKPEEVVRCASPDVDFGSWHTEKPLFSLLGVELVPGLRALAQSVSIASFENAAVLTARSVGQQKNFMMCLGSEGKERAIAMAMLVVRCER